MTLCDLETGYFYFATKAQKHEEPQSLKRYSKQNYLQAQHILIKHAPTHPYAPPRRGTPLFGHSVQIQTGAVLLYNSPFIIHNSSFFSPFTLHASRFTLPFIPYHHLTISPFIIPFTYELITYSLITSLLPHPLSPLHHLTISPLHHLTTYPLHHSYHSPFPIHNSQLIIHNSFTFHSLKSDAARSCRRLQVFHHLQLPLFTFHLSPFTFHPSPFTS